MTRLWGGRYSGDIDQRMWRFNASIGVDIRLAAADVRGSQAYARALEHAKVLSAAEAKEIARGLEVIANEIREGIFEPQEGDEDIHTAVERRLGELIGPLAGKLHTGRSRNDQVATDVRLWMCEALPLLGEALRDTQAAIVETASRHLDVLMPGYTHLQPAMPVRFSHWLLSFFWMLQRDRERLADLLPRVAQSPLGAAALAGNAFGVDRLALAEDLGWGSVLENSMDAVSARDMLLETLSWGAILGTHLSRLAEDLILYASAEFGFVWLAERYTTGSSIMPQKRNPDSLELVRGKCGRLVGNLTRLLVTVKGIPSTYDKDLQEDKEPLFDTVDTLADLLPIVAGVIRTLEVRPERMRAALSDAMLATDLADHMVRRGVPFREAHHVVGRAVRLAEESGTALGQLSLEQYQALWPQFDATLYEVLSYAGSVESHTARGGTARAAVEQQLVLARASLEKR
ncbi:MAG: argininosuccinate lyase [Anaerolineae bacterium]|jgi:argininosuccinate lyase